MDMALGNRVWHGGSAGLTVGSDNLNGLFQPWQFYDSMIHLAPATFACAIQLMFCFILYWVTYA